MVHGSFPPNYHRLLVNDLVIWRLFVSDDGSTDETLSLISKYQREGGVSVAVRDGPRRGLVRNFLGLACDLSISADYFAFSDQDDIWEPEKLSRAIEWLQSIPAQKPCLVLFARAPH